MKRCSLPRNARDRCVVLRCWLPLAAYLGLCFAQCPVQPQRFLRGGQFVVGKGVKKRLQAVELICCSLIFGSYVFVVAAGVLALLLDLPELEGLATSTQADTNHMVILKYHWQNRRWPAGVPAYRKQLHS